MRLGIYGGSFDPVHRGHVAAAEAVRRARGLATVLLIPAARAPHKPGEASASFADRVAMAERACAGRDGLAVSDLEGRRAGPSYTIDTVEALARERPGAALELLVGGDMLADLPGWRRADELVRAVRVVGFGRPGIDVVAARAVFEARFGAGAYAWVEVPAVDASSTEVRRRLAAGEPVADLLDPAVFTFIAEKGLYQGGNRG